MKLPKPATTVMLESIVVAQTVTLALIVQLDTKVMLQKVDRVCLVFPVNFKMKRANNRANNVKQIPKVKTRLRSVVNPVVLVKKRVPAVRNVRNVMPVKQEQVQVVNVNFVQKVNTALVQILLHRARTVRWVGRPRKGVPNVNSAVQEHTVTSLEKNAKIVHWNTPEEVLIQMVHNARDAFWVKQLRVKVQPRAVGAI
jgi:hypothetical protein